MNEAISLYREVISLFPSDLQTYRQFGSFLVERGFYIEAEVFLKRAVTLFPNSHQIYFLLGGVSPTFYFDFTISSNFLISLCRLSIIKNDLRRLCTITMKRIESSQHTTVQNPTSVPPYSLLAERRRPSATTKRLFHIWWTTRVYSTTTVLYWELWIEKMKRFTSWKRC